MEDPYDDREKEELDDHVEQEESDEQVEEMEERYLEV